MYEMLTGEVAFTGQSVQAVIAKRFVYTPPPVTDSRPEVPAVVGDTVRGCFSVRPTRGSRTGAQVVAALRAQPTPPVAPASGAGPRPPRHVDRGAAVHQPERRSATTSTSATDSPRSSSPTSSGVKALRVISRASSLQLKGTTQGHARDRAARLACATR